MNRHTSLITKAACSFSICIVWFYCGLLEGWPMPPLRNILMIGIDIFLIHFVCLVVVGFIFRVLSRPKRET
ncbi:MAG: hypothetical protein O2856_17645 [Planctomycetota bacterium]|nr:hypothetical protein [Planctomycetota bacterium]